MPNLRNQIVAYQPRQAPAIQQHRIPRLRGPTSQPFQDSYADTLGQRSIEYPVKVDLSKPVGQAIKAVKSAYQFLAPHLPVTPFKPATPVSKSSKPPRNSFVSLKLEPTFVLRGTNTEVPASLVRENTVSGRPTGIPYINSPSGPLIVTQVSKPSQGTYTMSRTGKNALSNVFRGTNTSSTRNAPTAISRRMNVVNKPKITSSSRGIVIAHKEYMSNIVSSSVASGFNAVGLTLNPGRMTAFPWLSTIAVNFDKYRILKCVVSLVTNQPTSTAGRVGVGFDYDSTDPVPDDRTDFFSLTHHSECAVWDSLDFNIPLQGGVRFVNSHTSTDSKLIDYGQVIIMADQVAATSANLGDVIISYVVELIDPQQALMLTYQFLGQNAATFDRFNAYGPVIAENLATSSTTVQQWKLAIGYYMVVGTSYDVGAGSPTISFDHSSGTTGKWNGANDTTSSNIIEWIHVLKDEALLQATIGTVTIANSETVSFTITRISPTIYVKTVAGTLKSNITASL